MIKSWSDQLLINYILTLYEKLVKIGVVRNFVRIFERCCNVLGFSVVCSGLWLRWGLDGISAFWVFVVAFLGCGTGAELWVVTAG